jgi:hypothetical protein
MFDCFNFGYLVLDEIDYYDFRIPFHILDIDF